MLAAPQPVTRPTAAPSFEPRGRACRNRNDFGKVKTMGTYSVHVTNNAGGPTPWNSPAMPLTEALEKIRNTNDWPRTQTAGSHATLYEDGRPCRGYDDPKTGEWIDLTNRFGRLECDPGPAE